jgi:hypothetical protein
LIVQFDFCTLVEIAFKGNITQFPSNNDHRIQDIIAGKLCNIAFKGDLDEGTKVELDNQLYKIDDWYRLNLQVQGVLLQLHGCVR